MVNFKISNINKHNNKHTHNNIINQLVIYIHEKTLTNLHKQKIKQTNRYIP